MDISAETFIHFRKIPRLSRECVVTEKIDGTNGQIYFDDDMNMLVGSRNRWLTLANDNYGFYRWAHDHIEELMQLGPGRHYGEWWGQGIQRRYGLDHKRFSLFNVHRWNSENVPSCCHVVPTLYCGMFDTFIIGGLLKTMQEHGSMAAPGFMNPEGVVIYHTAARQLFKKTIDNDEGGKQ